MNSISSPTLPLEDGGGAESSRLLIMPGLSCDQPQPRSPLRVISLEQKNYDGLGVLGQELEGRDQYTYVLLFHSVFPLRDASRPHGGPILGMGWGRVSADTAPKPRVSSGDVASLSLVSTRNSDPRQTPQTQDHSYRR